MVIGMPVARWNAADHLDPGVLAACRTEPLLSSLGPGHLVELPQRVLRQPKRRPGVAPPPLIRMLGAGRQAAEVRVRTYLWLWASLSTRHYADVNLRRTTGEWARLVGVLTDDAVHHQRKRAEAARRVSRAIHYLSSECLVAKAGDHVITLLDPDGSATPYRPWSNDERAERERARGDLSRAYGYRTDYRRSQVWEDNPLMVPATLWTNGTITTLSAAATVALLVLWDYETKPGAIIDLPKSRAYEYPVTHSTWHKGLAELETNGIIRRKPGALIFTAGNNPRTDTDRHRNRWRIEHLSLEVV